MEYRESYIPHAGWLEHEPADDVAHFLAQGWFEYKEQAFLWLYLRPGDFFLDCGAHVGLFSLVAARAMNDYGTIVAVEPHPGSASLLDTNLRANGVTCAGIRRMALFSDPGPVTLHAGGAGKAAYSSLAPIDGAVNTLPVEAGTLDALLGGSNEGFTNLAKIDVEGAELDVLKGAAESIQRGRLPLLIIECTEANLALFGGTTEALFLALSSSGYTVCRFDPDTGRLVAREYSGPIGYDNLFAARQPEEVNRRLSSAAEPARRIANDILMRGAAAEKLYIQSLRIGQAERRAGTWEVRAAEAHVAAQESERRAEEARQHAERAAQAAEEAFRNLGEANWRAEQSAKRADASEVRAAEARSAAQESERRAEEGHKHAEEAARSAEDAYRRLGEASWRAEQAEKRGAAAERRADETRRCAEDLLRSAESTLQRLGAADGRVEQAENRALRSGEAALQHAALAAEMRLRLQEVLASRYVRAGWKFGLARKPAWVNPDASVKPLINGEAVFCGPGLGVETEMMRALRHLDEKKFRPQVVLDVGAAKGYWSILAGGYFRDARFYLLEPLSENEADLRELCGKDPRQHYILTGAGDTPGVRPIQIGSELDSSTMLLFPGADVSTQRSLTITTVDRLLEEGRIERPDLVKIDVQGMELQVLEGSQKLFNYTDVFIIEVNLFVFLPGCPRVHEIIKYMADRDYYLFDLAGSLRRPFEDDLGQLDLVMVSARSPLTASNRWL